MDNIEYTSLYTVTPVYEHFNEAREPWKSWQWNDWNILLTRLKIGKKQNN